MVVTLLSENLICRSDKIISLTVYISSGRTGARAHSRPTKAEMVSLQIVD